MLTLYNSQYIINYFLKFGGQTVTCYYYCYFHFIDAGSINNYEEPSRRKTKKADGDEDDNALRCWPPPRPQGSTQSHENGGGAVLSSAVL